MHLNLNAVKNDASERMAALLQTKAEERGRDQIYDASGAVRPSVMDEVYREALQQALDTGTRYYTSSDLTVQLEYIDGQWFITADSPLISALSGGTAS
jgi:hypothetical protein